MRRDALLIGSIAALTLLLPQLVEARTAPEPGAAAKPERFRLQAPFPCGVKFRVNCGYGPHCSPAHQRITATGATNDYYALDLVRTEAGGGYAKPVVAVAPGTVRIAGWARRGWAPYGKIVYIEHGFRGDKGHRYQTLYGHLSSVLVRAGERVTRGQPIGTLGGSSRRRLLRYGPHLHFAMYRDARSTLGGGQAVVPEPFGAAEDMRPGLVLEACASEAQPVASLKPDPTWAYGGWLGPVQASDPWVYDLGLEDSTVLTSLPRD